MLAILKIDLIKKETTSLSSLLWKIKSSIHKVLLKRQNYCSNIQNNILTTLSKRQSSLLNAAVENKTVWKERLHSSCFLWICKTEWCLDGMQQRITGNQDVFIKEYIQKKQILILIWAREEGKFTTPRWLSQVNSKTVKAVRLAFYKIQ